jgi:hypothetical protein
MHCFSMKWSYLTGAADPSDHVPTGTINTSIGSAAPLNCRCSITVDFGRSAPHALASRPAGYFWPLLTADGKLDCAPK